MLHDFADANHAQEAMDEAEEFYNLLEASEKPVHDHTKETTLSAVTRLINFKSQFTVSAASYNTLMKLICDLLPENSVIPKNFNESKKMLSSLGMPYEKIDACYNGCMLFRDVCCFVRNTRIKQYVTNAKNLDTIREILVV